MRSFSASFTSSAMRWGAVCAALSGCGGGGSGNGTVPQMDQTPPTVLIVVPPGGLRAGPGLPVDVQVSAHDASGISEVLLQAGGAVTWESSQLQSGGPIDATPTFRLFVPLAAPTGATVTLDARAVDLHSNIGMATQVTLTVDPTIQIAAATGLTAVPFAPAAAGFLGSATAVAVSPKDGNVYVADNTASPPCSSSCIREIDAATGSPAAAAVVVGAGVIEGLAFDATGDNLYYSDRPNRVMRLTWDTGAGVYAAPVSCNDVALASPTDPYHLVVDPSLGLLVVDDGSLAVVRQGCSGTAPTDLSAGALVQPRGIAVGAAGEIFVADGSAGTIAEVDRTTGAVTTFQATGLGTPRGIEWLAGTSSWADSLLVADAGLFQIVAVDGTLATPVAYLTVVPVDVAVAGSFAYVLTSSAGLFRVGGF